MVIPWRATPDDSFSQPGYVAFGASVIQLEEKIYPSSRFYSIPEKILVFDLHVCWTKVIGRITSMLDYVVFDRTRFYPHSGRREEFILLYAAFFEQALIKIFREGRIGTVTDGPSTKGRLGGCLHEKAHAL